MRDLFSVGWFIVVCNQTYNGDVICKLYHGVGGLDGGAVVHEEWVEEWAENTSLWCVCVEDDGRGCSLLHPGTLWSVAEEIQYPMSTENCPGPDGSVFWQVSMELLYLRLNWSPQKNNQPCSWMFTFQMSKGRMENWDHSVLCWSVAPVCKLMLIKVAWNSRSDVGNDQSLKAFWNNVGLSNQAEVL